MTVSLHRPTFASLALGLFALGLGSMAAAQSNATPQLLAQGHAAQTSLHTVSFKLAPKNATLTLGGNKLVLAQGQNGALTASLPPGRHLVRIEAAGYASQQLELAVSSKMPEQEIKLERTGSSLTFVRMAKTSQRPKSLAYTPDGKWLLSAPLSGYGLDILDAAATGPLKTVQAPKEQAKFQGFVEIAFPAGKSEVWVSQMHTDRIHVYSLKDFSYIKALPSGGSFPKVLLAHADGRVFVANWISETVSVLDGQGKRLASIKTKGTPRGLAFSSDGSTLYIASFGKGFIEEFDAQSYERRRIFYDGTTPGEPKGSAMRHLVVRGDRLYASDLELGCVYVYDLARKKHLAAISIGQKTNTIALSPDGRWLFVSTRGPNNAIDYERKGPAFGELVLVDTLRLGVVDRQWGGNQPTGLAVSADGRQVAFSDFLDHRIELYDFDPAVALRRPVEVQTQAQR